MNLSWCNPGSAKRLLLKYGELKTTWTRQQNRWKMLVLILHRRWISLKGTASSKFDFKHSFYHDLNLWRDFSQLVWRILRWCFSTECSLHYVQWFNVENTYWVFRGRVTFSPAVQRMKNVFIQLTVIDWVFTLINLIQLIKCEPISVLVKAQVLVQA